MGIPSDLAKAKQLAKYWDNYVAHLDNLDEQQPNVGQGADKPEQTTLYVKPFGMELATQQYAKVQANAARWTAYGANFANYAKTDINEGGGESFLKLRGFRAAKVVIKTGVTNTKTVKTSLGTKRKYVDYGGTSGGVAFGQNANEAELEAYQTIRGLITGTGFNSATTKISRIKEKV